MKARHLECECVAYINENEVDVLAEANHFCYRNNIEVYDIIVREAVREEAGVKGEWECRIYFCHTGKIFGDNIRY